MARGKAPNLTTERSRLAEGHFSVCGSDEVGRGSLAGPVTVGVVVVDADTRRPPGGLRDSKLLTATAREALVPRIERWSVAQAVGHADAAEIDRFGIMRALRLAGERALAALPCPPSMVLLDGNFDWFRRPMRSAGSPLSVEPVEVELRIKADLACASVAAASVMAKVARDRLMREMHVEFPGYGWELNKGYATSEHMAALREIGPSVQHRRSWRLPGSDQDQDQLELELERS